MSEEFAVNTDPFGIPGFDLPGRGKAAVLCLHGLTSTPYEVRPIGEALVKRGVAALGPVLAGHCSSPEQLARVSYREWLAEARSNFDLLRARYETVFVVGVSLGGLLALSLAADRKVEALAVVSTPLRVEHRFARLVPFLKFFIEHQVKENGPDIRDEMAKAKHPTYPVTPLHAVHELQRLQARVRPRLEHVRAPILVAHGAKDRVTSPENAQEILAAVSSQEREHLLLASSGHVATVDVDGPALATAIADFLVRRSSRIHSGS